MIDDVYVTGVEFTSECVPYIKDSSVDMLSFYFVENTGYITIENTVKYLNGEEIPAFIEVFHEIISIDNVDTITPEM